jgi:tetratricopeptide (TPR) repeat protein
MVIAGLAFWAGRHIDQHPKPEPVALQQETVAADQMQPDRHIDGEAHSDASGTLPPPPPLEPGTPPPIFVPLPPSRPSSTPSISPTIEAAQEAMERRAYDKAAEALKQALAEETDPGKKQQIRAMLAESLAASQDFDGAGAVYREYLAGATSDEERVLGVSRLAAVLSLQKRFDEAEALLADPGLIGDDPAQRQAIQFAQLLLWQSRPGRLDEVAGELEAKTSADPADRESLELLGTIYLRVQRDHDKAKPVYEKMLAQDPDNPGLQNTLIGIYQETRDYGKARDIYERYLEHHPEQADGIRFQIAALYVQSGQGDDAVAYAREHLAGPQATAEQREQAARIYEFSGRLDDAAQLLQEAQSVAPDAGKKTDLQLRQVDLLARQEKYAEAETLVRRILTENPANRDIRARANQELIRLYQMQGKVGELDL